MVGFRHCNGGRYNCMAIDMKWLFFALFVGCASSHNPASFDAGTDAGTDADVCDPYNSEEPTLCHWRTEKGIADVLLQPRRD
jgi:hypothetical protein